MLQYIRLFNDHTSVIKVTILLQNLPRKRGFNFNVFYKWDLNVNRYLQSVLDCVPRWWTIIRSCQYPWQSISFQIEVVQNLYNRRSSFSAEFL